MGESFQTHLSYPYRIKIVFDPREPYNFIFLLHCNEYLNLVYVTMHRISKGPRIFSSRFREKDSTTTFLFSHILLVEVYIYIYSNGVNDASYWPRKNASGKYSMDSQCNWLNGSSKARKEERRGGVFFWVYVTPRVRPDITEQIEAESCSYPAVCSAAPRECGLLPSSQQTIHLSLSPSPSLYFPLPAVFHIPQRLFLFPPSIQPSLSFSLAFLPHSLLACALQATPDLTPPGRTPSQP